MPLVTSTPRQDDVPTTAAHRGRVWRATSAPAARRGRVWRAHRGRVWPDALAPEIAPEVVGSHLDDLDVVSPWTAARRGRVWRSRTMDAAGHRASVRAWIVMFVVTVMIALGAYAATNLDDLAAPAAPVLGVPDSEGRISLRTVADQVGATDMWARGLSGAGVNVAVLDTGVAPVPALDDAVIATVDTSADHDDPELRYVDGYGHGTHLAGIVAGRDDTTGFTGIAPRAGIVSVKVADAQGNVSSDSVVTGIDWVISHADELGIRVITLALDTADTSDYRTSALAAAVERAWAAGIVVVTAAGNGGPEAAGISLPARDPYVITVAGLDTEHDLAAADWATPGDAARTPDIAAPGAHLMSLRAPGSVADRDHSEGYVDEELFLGSGSSQAAAVVSGLVAMMIEAEPWLTPDQVKADLAATAGALADDAALVGAGMVRGDVAARAHATGVTQTWPRATPGPRIVHTPGVSTVADWASKSWTSKSWTSKSWTSKSWTSKSWTSKSWTSKSWTSKSWTSKSWTSKSWTSKSWTSKSWTSKSWTSKSWTSKSWTSKSWTSKSWTSKSWTSKSWTSKSWTSKSWTSKSWTSKSWTSKSWTSKSWTSKSWTSKSWT